MSPDETIRQAVRARMAELGMTQQQLAERMGWRQSQISRFLRGYQGMSAEKFSQLMSILRLKVTVTPDK